MKDRIVAYTALILALLGLNDVLSRYVASFPNLIKNVSAANYNVWPTYVES